VQVAALQCLSVTALLHDMQVPPTQVPVAQSESAAQVDPSHIVVDP
jgi:hypothetical protein